MKKLKYSLMLMTLTVFFAGCDSLRFAPRQEQKQNAYLHWRVTDLAANQAVEENASPQLSALTSLASRQSRAFVADYGLPKELPAATTAEEILAAAPAIAQQAHQQSLERPDVFQVADGAMELGIALAGLLGGATGIRLAQFLRQTREKSQALKEIIEGNELFKQEFPAQADAFKSAHKAQSPETRKLVAETKFP